MKDLLIISKGEIAEEISAAFSQNSVTSTICRQEDLKGLIAKRRFDGVFDTEFCAKRASLCQKMGMPYICWILTDKPYGIFCKELFFETNRIFAADRLLYDILRDMGIKKVYRKTAAFKSRLKDEKRPGEAKRVFERMALFMDEGEIWFLRGLMKAKALDHRSRILFEGPGQGLIDKCLTVINMAYLKPLAARYYLAECILKEVVRKEEVEKIDKLPLKEGEYIAAFDDRGIESLRKIAAGKRLYSDGCGLEESCLKEGRDYIGYSAPADIYKRAEERQLKGDIRLPFSCTPAGAVGEIIKICDDF